jgi:hypothetical protein
MSDWTRDAAGAPLLPPTLGLFLRRRGAEAAGLALLALAAAFAAALPSYYPRDPCWFFLSTEAPRNWFGVWYALNNDPVLRGLHTRLVRLFFQLSSPFPSSSVN